MKRLLRWFSNVPIEDPVDRRNAPFLQTLLLFFGVFVPLNKALFLYALLSGRWKGPSPGPMQLTADLVTDVLLAGSAWVAFWLIRHGRFRPGVRLFLGVALACVGIAYASFGLMHLNFDPIPPLLLSIAGLVMGRRTMWIALAALAGIMASCVALDLIHPARAAEAKAAVVIGKAVSIVGIWLLIAMLLDRTVAALRDSLEESNARSRELELAYQRVQEEAAERERAHEQLIHAQKMEAVGRLASGVAHDFNTILSIILNYATQRDRLSDEGAAALYQALEGVELASRRAIATSRKLLNFSRREIARPETFDAGQALLELRPMLRQLLGERIELSVDCGDEPLPVRLDRGRFELMLLNIAANARDAIAGTQAGAGRFRIHAGRDHATQRLALSLSDNGGGMSETIRARAFDPFFTTKRNGEGTGLGLSVVRDMVIEAGGEIGLESDTTGATIRIALPLDR